MAPGRGRALASHLLFLPSVRSFWSSGTATTALVPPPRHVSEGRGAIRQKARPSASATPLNATLDKEQQGGPAHRRQREVLGQQFTIFAAARFARRKSRRTACLGGMRASAAASLAVSTRTAGRRQGARGTETSASRFLPPASPWASCGLPGSARVDTATAASPFPLWLPMRTRPALGARSRQLSPLLPSIWRRG